MKESCTTATTGSGNGGTGGGGSGSPGTSPPTHGVQQCVSPTTGEMSVTETLPFGNPETTRAQAEAGIKQGKRVCFCVN